MNRNIDINKVIVGILNGLCLNNIEVLVDNKKIDVKIIEKCIISYYNLENIYKEFKKIKVNEKIYNEIVPYLNDYSSNNIINSKLTEELKKHFDKCDNIEIHSELKKYMQNRLTNIEVIKYIKELIKEKDLYIYDSYNNMTENDAKKEIDRLTKMLAILDKLDYKTNELGIKYKSIYFEPQSVEYNSISPSLNLDIYEIEFYKRLLMKLKHRLMK